MLYLELELKTGERFKSKSLDDAQLLALRNEASPSEAAASLAETLREMIAGVSYSMELENGDFIVCRPETIKHILVKLEP